MGTDFLKKTEKSFKRQWSHGLESLAQPDLFTQNPQLKRRTFVMHRTCEAQFAPGEQLIARVEGDKLVVDRENTSVGELRDVSAEVVMALKASGGYGKIVVEKVLPVSGAADVSLK